MADQATVHKRRDWQALWSSVWGGLSLIIIGYIFWQVRGASPEVEGFSRRSLELFISYWSLALMLIDVYMIGNGVIAYTKVR